VNQAELLGDMPQALLTEALDDNRDGAADDDAWAAVQVAAEERIRSAFGGDAPAKHAIAAAHARKVFLLEILYNRRGFTGDANPHTAAANRVEKRLEALAAGEVSTDGGDAEPVFIGQPAKVAGLRGNMA
jgi:hypothetical protein